MAARTADQQAVDRLLAHDLAMNLWLSFCRATPDLDRGRREWIWRAVLERDHWAEAVAERIGEAGY